MPQSTPVASAPQLLVSVRNPDEGLLALAGGCDIVDIKDPARGSLGQADASVCEAVIAAVRARAPRMPISIAVGDASDRDQPAECPRLDQVEWAKLGTAGLAAEGGWPRRFREACLARESLARVAPGRGWVVVAYADWQRACAPAPSEVISRSSALGVVGVLIDTWEKASGSLLDWATPAELAHLREAARAKHLLFALAGRLTTADLTAIVECPPDIVGIRSAACRAGVRDATIDAQSVARFRRHLHRTDRGRQTPNATAAACSFRQASGADPSAASLRSRAHGLAR